MNFFLLVHACLLCFLLLTSSLHAGVTNPDISVLGQMRGFVTDDSADINRNRTQLSFDESEIVAVAYLNPYAHGTFVFAVADGEIEVEEGYMEVIRGLPAGIALRAGKYRVGFGKLNPMHSHAYPFIERFRVLEAYLPGEESFNEIGAQLSYRLPLAGDLSSEFYADILQGYSFHPDEEESRPAVGGRWSNFVLLKDPSALEIGMSVAHGTNHVAMRTRSTILGADFKMKLWQSPHNFLVVQGEFLNLNRGDASEDTLTQDVSKNQEHLFGGYLFADYTVRKRYNMGLKYERFQRPELSDTGEKLWDQAFGAFAGLALMEETTLFRIVWDRFLPESGQAYNTLTFQIVFSMGPHKPHEF